MEIDWSQIFAALIITMPPTVASIWVGFINRRNAARVAAAAAEALKQTHDLVNGQSAKLNAMYEARGEATGVQKGADAERANPTRVGKPVRKATQTKP